MSTLPNKPLPAVPSMPEVGREFSKSLARNITAALAWRTPADAAIWCSEALPSIVGDGLRREVFSRLAGLCDRWRELAEDNESAGLPAARLTDAQRACAQDLEDALAGHAYPPSDRVTSARPPAGAVLQSALPVCVAGAQSLPPGFVLVRVAVPEDVARSLLSGQVPSLLLSVGMPDTTSTI